MTAKLALVSFSLAAAACAQIAAPRAACVVAKDQTLRPVFGVAGVLVPGDAVATGVLAAACSSQAALVKTEQYLELRDGELRPVARWAVPPGRAQLALGPTAASPAFAFFPATGELFRIQNRQITRVPLAYGSLTGDVLALATDGSPYLHAAVREQETVHVVRIALWNGGVVSGILRNEANGPALVRADGTLLYTSGTAVVLERPGLAPERFALPAAPSSLYAMGDQWTGIALANGAAVVLKVSAAGAQLLRMPEVAQ